MKTTKSLIGNKLNLTKASAIVVALGLSACGAFAAATAFDTAANYVGPGWSTTPANLGTGFGAWNIAAINNNNPPYSGTYLDQTSYGNAGSVLNAGYSWGTYANGTDANGDIPALNMVRPFTTGGGTSSLLNQTFSVGIGSGGVGGAGSSLSVNIGTAFSLIYAGGGPDNMTLSVDGGAASPIAVNMANLGAGLRIALSVTGPMNSPSEGYSLAFSPYFGGPTFLTINGTFDSSAYNTAGFTFLDYNTSANGYVNDLSIIAVPEPSSLALLGLSGLTTLLAIRRRK